MIRSTAELYPQSTWSVLNQVRKNQASQVRKIRVRQPYHRGAVQVRRSIYCGKSALQRKCSGMWPYPFPLAFSCEQLKRFTVDAQLLGKIVTRA